MRRAPIFDTADSAAEAFYDAMRRGDLAGMMDLWSTDDDVACTHPGHERLVGLEAIRSSWEGIFANGGVEVEASNAVVLPGAVMTVHHLIERIAVNAPFGNQLLECVVTNVYVKTSLGWRIALHHGSPASRTRAAAPADAVLH